GALQLVATDDRARILDGQLQSLAFILRATDTRPPPAGAAVHLRLWRAALASRRRTRGRCAADAGRVLDLHEPRGRRRMRRAYSTTPGWLSSQSCVPHRSRRADGGGSTNGSFVRIRGEAGATEKESAK